MMKRILILGALIAAAILPGRAFAETDTLCPSVEEMKGKAPDALTGVQSDIDRLTLCIERARLLKQLDDIVADRKELLAKIQGGTDTLAASSGLGIPPIPAGALPPVSGIDTKNLKPGEVKINSAVEGAFDQTIASLAPPDWQVRKIWGQGAGIRAQLTDGKGVLVNVVKGDPLPDGAVIEALSVRGVTISRNGKVLDLSWEQVTDAHDPKTTP